jgi:alkanesulfonate monooxygenase SsuD/methylene tetrahydromethanopterin reductase-like flavin-dependent oxidoreductase (luciferase family)
MMQVRGRAFRFGIQLIPQRVIWPKYATALQAVERLGFDTVWAFDHLLPYCGPDGDACLETLTTLGAMAVRVAAAQGSDLDSQRDNWIIGTPDEAIDQLRRYAKASVSHWILHLNAPFDLPLLELLRDAVVPAFR